MALTIGLAGDDDLDELLGLMRAYCDFYEVAPTDSQLLELSRALIADPAREGVQLIARDESATAVGFASVFWSWATTRGARLAVMNDLFVAPDARGSGVADALIAECLDRARAHGAAALEWQTATTNLRAQAVYQRMGGERSEEWLDYSLAT